VPECQEIKNGETSIAKCKAFTELAVKGLRWFRLYSFHYVIHTPYLQWCVVWWLH